MNCTIQLKPMLQEFVISAWLNGTLKVSAKDPFGKIIKHLLTTAPADYEPHCPQQMMLWDWSSDFTFTLPRYKNLNTNRKCYITPQTQELLQTYIDFIFTQTLYLYVRQITEENGVEIKQAIFSFLKYYNIEGHYIDYETLLKKYYRYRKVYGGRILQRKTTIY
jgi:hypothetical protein